MAGPDAGSSHDAHSRQQQQQEQQNTGHKQSFASNTQLKQFQQQQQQQQQHPAKDFSTQPSSFLQSSTNGFISHQNNSHADLTQYTSSMAPTSFGSNSNFAFNNTQITGSPSAHPPEHSYRRYSNNSNTEKVGFMNSGSSFTAPRASLLTSKLAKVQKNKPSVSSPSNEKTNDDPKSGYPYPNPKTLNHRTNSSTNMKGIVINNQRVSPTGNSTSSLSSSFKYNKPETSQFYSSQSEARSFMAYNAPSAVSSSYSSAPVSLGKSNGFIPIESENLGFTGFQPHSIAAPGAGNINNSFHTSSFHFPRPAPPTATTNISMETASSNFQNNNNNNNNNNNLSSSTITDTHQLDQLLYPLSFAKATSSTGSGSSHNNHKH